MPSGAWGGQALLANTPPEFGWVRPPATLQTEAELFSICFGRQQTVHKYIPVESTSANISWYSSVTKMKEARTGFAEAECGPSKCWIREVHPRQNRFIHNTAAGIQSWTGYRTRPTEALQKLFRDKSCRFSQVLLQAALQELQTLQVNTGARTGCSWSGGCIDFWVKRWVSSP